MIRIALAIVTSVGLAFAADAQTSYVHHVRAHHWEGAAYHLGPGQVGPLCQTPNGTLVVCGGSEVGPLCQVSNGTLVVCSGGGAEAGPLCQIPNGTLVVCG
jgi:hypothetical protein